MEVAIGIIKNAKSEVLITERPNGSYMGGYWEFPGGKVEGDETVFQALKREFQEEVGLEIITSQPLITYHHRYPDRGVHLHTHLVTDYQGTAQPLEGQQLQWLPIDELKNWNMLPANLPMIHALQLPPVYWITPEIDGDYNRFIARFQRMLDQGTKLIRFRSHQLNDQQYAELVPELLALAHKHQAQLMIDHELSHFAQLDADGFHLNRHQLMQLKERPISQDKWLGCSCHNIEEVHQANRIQADFITLSPVDSTPSHPDALPLGWLQFLALVNEAKMPVYALGGLTQRDLQTAIAHGGQGVAGMRGLSEMPEG